MNLLVPAGVFLALAAWAAIWTSNKSDEEYKKRKEKDKKWEEEQPKYFVSVLLKTGGVLNSRVFSAKVYYEGLRSYRIRHTAEELAKEWVRHAFKAGFVQIGDEVYPIKSVKKMIFVKVDND
jgi:hypothetical protein